MKGIFSYFSIDGLISKWPNVSVSQCYLYYLPFRDFDYRFLRYQIYQIIRFYDWSKNLSFCNHFNIWYFKNIDQLGGRILQSSL